MKHPAKYSDELLPIFGKYLEGKKLVLDPFAGTGKLKLICQHAILLEIEYEWASMCGAVVADSQRMPFCNNSFEAICTSPTYGNRMADHFIDHQKDKKYVRHTYHHYLGRDLNINNSGKMQWGNNYRELHTNVWCECYRVLKSTGILILNISDHIRNKTIMPVSDWHKNELKNIGFRLINEHRVNTKRQKHGENSGARVDYENIFVFVK